MFQEMQKMKACLNTYAGIVDPEGILKPYITGKEKEAARNPFTIIKAATPKSGTSKEPDTAAAAAEECNIPNDDNDDAHTNPKENSYEKNDNQSRSSSISFDLEPEPTIKSHFH